MEGVGRDLITLSDRGAGIFYRYVGGDSKADWNILLKGTCFFLTSFRRLGKRKTGTLNINIMVGVIKSLVLCHVSMGQIPVS